MNDSILRLLPNWEEFEKDYVLGGVPHLFLVREKPEVTLFVDQGAARFGARFAVPARAGVAAVSTLSEIDIRDVFISGQRFVEVSTRARQLFPNFFGLVGEVVFEVVRGVEPREALQAAISRWEALLSRKPLLADEAQAGLFGELWFLRRLVEARKEDAVRCWTGPTRQAHDFRMGDVELEVKTTSGARRLHLINGVMQLQPSPGCSLYLLSLQLADAGSGGQTLPEAINDVARLLEPRPQIASEFWRLLEEVGYRREDCDLYPRRRRLRTEPRLVLIAPGVPRITPDALLSLPAAFAPGRIGRVTYEIDVDGMGHEPGEPEFDAIVPPVF